MKWQVNCIHVYMQMSQPCVISMIRKMQQRERQTRILSLPYSRLLLYRCVTEVETDWAVYSYDSQAYFHILIQVG